MNPCEILTMCDHAYVVLHRDGEQVEVETLFPDEHPLTTDLLEVLRAHKPVLLAYLDFVVEADAALLESTHRLAGAWPKNGPVLAGVEWDAFEDELADAYRRQDRAALDGTVTRREAFALDVFDRFRTEAR